MAVKGFMDGGVVEQVLSLFDGDDGLLVNNDVDAKMVGKASRL